MNLIAKYPWGISPNTVPGLGIRIVVCGTSSHTGLSSSGHSTMLSIKDINWRERVTHYHFICKCVCTCLRAQTDSLANKLKIIYLHTTVSVSYCVYVIVQM